MDLRKRKIVTLRNHNKIIIRKFYFQIYSSQLSNHVSITFQNLFGSKHCTIVRLAVYSIYCRAIYSISWLILMEKNKKNLCIEFINFNSLCETFRRYDYWPCAKLLVCKLVCNVKKKEKKWNHKQRKCGIKNLRGSMKFTDNEEVYRWCIVNYKSYRTRGWKL